MDTFFSLSKLLSNLHFSINGYHEPDKEIDRFFEELCKSDFIIRKKHIQLVSYSLAKLTDINDWSTESLSSKLFFHALNERYSLLILNAYYLFRERLFTKKGSNVALILSKLFVNDVGFRLSYTKEKSWTFSYLEQSNSFSIKIPLTECINSIEVDGEGASLADNCLHKFHQELNNYFKKEIEILKERDNSILIIDRIPKSKATYQKLQKEETEVKSENTEPEVEEIFTFIDNIFDKEKLNILKQEIVSVIIFWHKSNPGFFNDAKHKENIESWVELFFQILFISIVFNSWIEYFPAICGVIESNGERQFRNLGGLIIGYRLDSTISQEERSIFKVISARISSVVAGQLMYKTNLTNLIDLHRIKFKDFCEILNGTNSNKKFQDGHENYLHGNAECKEAKKLLTGLISEYKDSLGKDFDDWVKSHNGCFSKYLTILCCPSKETGNSINKKIANANYFDEKEFEIEKDGKSTNFYNELIKLNDDKISQYYLNIPLISKLLFEFHKIPSVLKSINFEDSILSMCYEHKFDVNSFYEKLTFSNREFSSFLIKNTIPILAMGNFQITKDNQIYFNLEKWYLKEIESKNEILEGFCLEFHFNHRN